MSKTGYAVPPPPRTSLVRDSLGWRLTAGALLAIMGISIYWNSFAGPFVFDDDLYILHNSSIRKLWPLPIAKGSNRPVGFFTFALNYACGGYEVWGYHAVNLAIHLTSAWLLFDIVRRTLSRGRLAGRYADHAWSLGLVMALVWMVHPLQTQSVTYIYQRLEALMGMFYLATLWCMVRSLDSCRRGWWQAASVACCALGMGTKEVMVTAPLAVLWYDRVFAAGSWRELFRSRGRYYAALFCTWGILAGLMLAYQEGYESSGVLVVSGVSPLGYALSQPGVILHYLRLAFWPAGQCLDYGWPVATRAAEIVPAALAVGGLVALSAWAAIRWPACGFLGGCFFLILAPTSSVAPLRDLAFEHRMYLPLVAVVVLAVMGMDWAWRQLWVRLKPGNLSASARMSGVWATAIVAVAALGYRTVRRNADYQTATVIWQSTVNERPKNARAQTNLGMALVLAGHADQAFTHFDQAVALDSQNADAYFSRARAYQKEGQDALAVEDFSRALALAPRRLHPAHYLRGESLERLGRYQEAVADLSAVVQASPRESLAYHVRGKAYKELGKEDLAFTDLNRAVELAPRNPEIITSRGIAYERFGKFNDALADFDRALELTPGNAPAYGERAKLLATCPDARFRAGARAVDDATRACELTDWKNAEWLDTLAAAYAEVGDFPAAVQWQSKAIALAAAGEKLRQAARQRLDLYRAGKPYHEGPSR